LAQDFAVQAWIQPKALLTLISGMAKSTCRRVLTGLVSSMLAQSSAKVLCENGTSSESCRVARPAWGAQDHLLLQVQRNHVSKLGGRAGFANCSFSTSPETPYYWEPNCSMGMVGCWADGMHAECRFCDYEYIQCPESAWRPIKDICSFDNEPLPANVGYYYEKACPDVDNGLGCNADGKNVGCRFCGGGAYEEVPCKVDQCTFVNEPASPYYFDHSCKMGMKGCMADGIHLGCRFCGRRPFNDIPCPASAAIPATECWFRNEPTVNYTWDWNCTMGEVGCWADGIHAECRFCGGGAGSPYSKPCP